ncbi:MAG TPA: hypothetical protein PKC18_12350, partial [Lacipirellulaceae bacterium]|nr:hypothetical protein [Lacipirellulaceae bacterium]
NALRELVVDLAARGQPALAERLQWLLGRPVSPQEVRQLAAGLTPDAVGAYRDRWFGATSAPISEPDDPQSRLPAGGWFRDDATLSLRYRSAGHADPWQRAWLDVLAKAASGPHADVAEPLLHAALSPTAPGQCGSCHTARRTPDGRWSIAWLASTGAPPARPQTHFSHRVHTLQSQLRDCTACHRTIPAAGSHATAADARPASAQFEPMSKASCAACHTAGAAGEACTQCHRYHTRVKGTAGELP